MVMFKQATREKNRLRLAIDGPSGAGKTYTALRFAFAIGKKICVIDTENGSAGKYVGDQPDEIKWQFDTCVLRSGQFAPSTYAATIQAAGAEGYDVIVVDSLSHAWAGAGGALEQVDRAGGNSFTTGWRDVTPQHNAMISAILESPAHIICTLRSKMEYVMEQDEKTGKTTVKKIGLKPIQRQGVEFEFDLIADMDINHTMTVSKSRCSVVDGQIVSKPTAAFMTPVISWLKDGVQPQVKPAFVPAQNTKTGPTTLKLNSKTDSNPPQLENEEEKKTALIKLVKELLTKTKTDPAEVHEWLHMRDKKKLSDLSHEELLAYCANLNAKNLINQQKTAF